MECECCKEKMVLVNDMRTMICPKCGHISPAPLEEIRIHYQRFPELQKELTFEDMKLLNDLQKQVEKNDLRDKFFMLIDILHDMKEAYIKQKGK